MFTNANRPLKRVHKACESCRRKKTRCSGEKPECAFCVRLGQPCSYADGSENSDRVAEIELRMEARLAALEDKIGIVLRETSLPQEVSSSQHESDSASETRTQSRENEVPWARKAYRPLPPKNVMDKIMALFLDRCNSQPLPLFHPALDHSYEVRDSAVLYAIAAVVVHFSDANTLQDDPEIAAKEYAEAAQRLASEKVLSGTVELSTIQTLCLLSFLDFHVGNTHRSLFQLENAMHLAELSGMTKELSQRPYDRFETEERRRCVWSLYLLDRMTGNRSRRITFPFGVQSMCLHPASPGKTSRGEIQAISEADENTSGRDRGIIAYSLMLYDVWDKVARYSSNSEAAAGKPLWTANSEYAAIVSSLMEFESGYPDKHRFEQGLRDHDNRILQENRAYWAPFMSIQFLYPTVLCLLNHPYLLSVRLGPIAASVPRTFSQAASDLVKLHSNWIVRSIDITKEKGFPIVDPFCAYCVAVAATVFDHHRMVGNAQTRRDSEEDFNKCVEFLRSVAHLWPIIACMVKLLQDLDRVSLEQLQPDSTSTASREPNTKAAILQKILNYCSVSQSSSTSTNTLFHPSLYSEKAAVTQPLRDSPATNGPTPSMANAPQNFPDPALQQAEILGRWRSDTDGHTEPLDRFVFQDPIQLDASLLNIAQNEREMREDYWWNLGGL